MIPHFHNLRPIVLTKAGTSLRWEVTQHRCWQIGIDPIRYENNCDSQKPKGYCATLGHLEIIKKLQREGQSFGFILEDDCCFSDNFTILYDQIIQELETLDWDLFYFGANILGSLGNHRLTQHIFKPMLAYCNHAYFIRDRVYQQAIDALEKSLAQDKTDVVDAIFADLPWNLFVSNPMLISQLPPVGTYEEINSIHDIMKKGYKRHVPN